ncbi:MAG: hypothetical protein RIS66_1292 [Actinomycetota bacterium]
MSPLYRVLVPEEELVGLPLIGMLSGFTDAGSSIGQISSHFFANLESELVIKFNNDELLDYRSRRPMLFFEKDHIESYEPAELGIYLMRDEAEQPFLVLDGYEPDFRWEAFSQATRPIGVTVSGNRKDLIDRFSEWKPQTQVPGNIVHLLEYTLSKTELPVTGFVLLVPHYLADNEVPGAAVTALELISAATGLVFPSDELRDSSKKFLAKVDSQLEENPELAKLVATLESSYSSTDGPAKAPIGKAPSEPPSADQLAEELENYLAAMRRTGEDKE